MRTILPDLFAGSRVHGANGCLRSIFAEIFERTAKEEGTGMVSRMTGRKHSSAFQRRLIDQVGQWAVRWRLPIDGPPHAGKNRSPQFGWLSPGNEDRATVTIDATCPGLLRERLRQDELAGLGLQKVVETVAISLGQKPFSLARDFTVEEHQDLGGIPVEDVVRGELEVPTQ